MTGEHTLREQAEFQAACRSGRYTPRQLLKRFGRLPQIAGASGPTLDRLLGAVGASATSVRLTVPGSVPAGRLLVVYGGTTQVWQGVTPQPVAGIADSGLNSYTRHVQPAVNVPGLLASTIVTSPLASGSGTITLTASGSTTAFVGAASFTGVAPNAARTAYGDNYGTQVTSVATSAQVQKGDLVIAAAVFRTMPTVSGPGAGWSPLNTATSGASGIYAAFTVPTSTGIVTWAPSLSAVHDYDTLMIVAFSAGSAGGMAMLV